MLFLPCRRQITICCRVSLSSTSPCTKMRCNQHRRAEGEEAEAEAERPRDGRDRQNTPTIRPRSPRARQMRRSHSLAGLLLVGDDLLVSHGLHHRHALRPRTPTSQQREQEGKKTGRAGKKGTERMGRSARIYVCCVQIVDTTQSKPGYTHTPRHFCFQFPDYR